MIEMRHFYLSKFETIWQQQYFHVDFNDLLYTSKPSAWNQYAKHYDKMTDVLNLKLLNPVIICLNGENNTKIYIYIKIYFLKLLHVYIIIDYEG